MATVTALRSLVALVVTPCVVVPIAAACGGRVLDEQAQATNDAATDAAEVRDDGGAERRDDCPAPGPTSPGGAGHGTLDVHFGDGGVATFGDVTGEARLVGLAVDEAGVSTVGESSEREGVGGPGGTMSRVDARGNVVKTARTSGGYDDPLIGFVAGPGAMFSGLIRERTPVTRSLLRSFTPAGEEVGTVDLGPSPLFTELVVTREGARVLAGKTGSSAQVSFGGDAMQVHGDVPAARLDQVVLASSPDDGRIYLARAWSMTEPRRTTADLVAYRNGAIDPTFTPDAIGCPLAEEGGVTAPPAMALVVDAQARPLLVCGERVVRFMTTGARDRCFGLDGMISVPRVSAPSRARGRDLAVQSDGKIIVAAFDSSVSVMRFLPDGSVDRGFGDDGIAAVLASPLTNGAGLKVVVAPDGRIRVAAAGRPAGAALPSSVYLATLLP